MSGCAGRPCCLLLDGYSMRNYLITRYFAPSREKKHGRGLRLLDTYSILTSRRHLHESCAVTQLLLDQNTLDCHCWPTIGLPHRVSSSCFVSPESADGLARKQVVEYATVRGTEENPYLANLRASLFSPSSEGEEGKKVVELGGSRAATRF